MRRHATTNRDIKRFRACAAVGLSMTETAHRCGVGLWVVRHWRRRLGLTFAPHRRRLDPAAKDKLAAMLAQLHAAER